MSVGCYEQKKSVYLCHLLLSAVTSFALFLLDIIIHLTNTPVPTSACFQTRFLCFHPFLSRECRDFDYFIFIGVNVWFCESSGSREGALLVTWSWVAVYLVKKTFAFREILQNIWSDLASSHEIQVANGISHACFPWDPLESKIHIAFGRGI